MKNAIILTSGGLDSTVLAYFTRKKLGYENIKIIFFDYGQKAILNERKSAKRCSVQIKGRFIEMIRENPNGNH